MADVFEAMARGTALGEDRLAARGVAFHRCHGLIVTQHLLPVGIARAVEQLGGTGADVGIFAREEAFAVLGVDVGGGDVVFFDAGEKLSMPGRTIENQIEGLRLYGWRGIPPCF